MDISDALDRAVIGSFADMAFMDAQAAAEQPMETQEEQRVAVSFSGSTPGCLTLHLTAPTKQRLVENIYGHGWEELAESVADDCLKEVANIITGNLLKELGYADFGQTVSLPTLLPEQEEAPESTDSTEKVVRSYDVDDTQVRVVLVYREPRTAASPPAAP
jgi:CheY-specific phosphatase CheX